MKRHLYLLVVLIAFGLLSSGCVEHTQVLPGSWSVVETVTGNQITVDSPTIAIYASQSSPIEILVPASISILVTPSDPDPSVIPLRPVITVYDATVDPVRVVASVTAPGVGQRALLQTFAFTVGHSYYITVSGVNDTTGYFVAALTHNAAIEEEEATVDTNSTVEVAQPIQASFLPSLKGSGRASVVGSLFDDSDRDTYSLTLAAGDTIDLVVETPHRPTAAAAGSSSAALIPNLAAAPGLTTMMTNASAAVDGSPILARLFDPSGSLVPPEKTYAIPSVDFAGRYRISKSGTYYVRVYAPDLPVGAALNYQVMLVRGGDIELEQNDRAEKAQPLNVGRPVFGYLGSDLPNLTSALNRDMAGAFPFSLGLGIEGNLYFDDGGGTQGSIVFRDLEYMSLVDPHSVFLVDTGVGGTIYRLNEVGYLRRDLGNLHIIEVMGNFMIPGSEPDGVHFRREIMWYETQSHLYVNTRLNNTAGSWTGGYSLVDRFNPAPGGIENTANDVRVDGNLLTAAAGDAAFGAGSASPGIILGFASRTDPQGTTGDDAMMLSRPIAKGSPSDINSAYYLLFQNTGGTATGIESAYQNALAEGFSLADFYQVTLKKGVPYRVEAYLPSQFNTPSFLPNLAVYQPNGKRIALWEGGLTGFGQAVRFVPQETGVYTIQLEQTPVAELLDINLTFGNDYVLMVDEDWRKTYLPLIGR